MMDSHPDAYTLGEILLSMGVITKYQCDHALRIAKRKNKRLGDVLVEHGVPREDVELAAEMQAKERSKPDPIATQVARVKALYPAVESATDRLFLALGFS